MGLPVFVAVWPFNPAGICDNAAWPRANSQLESRRMATLIDLNHQFLVDLYLDEESATYTAVIPELPGCVTEGDTLPEARALIIEAASLYLESLGDIHAEIPKTFPAPMQDLLPKHSIAVGLKDIATAMSLEPDHFMGAHVAMSNAASGKVVVFPVANDNLSSTTITLLVHYAGIDAAQFLQAIRQANELVDGDDESDDDDDDSDDTTAGAGFLEEADDGPEEDDGEDSSFLGPMEP